MCHIACCIMLQFMEMSSATHRKLIALNNKGKKVVHFFVPVHIKIVYACLTFPVYISERYCTLHWQSNVLHFLFFFSGVC